MSKPSSLAGFATACLVFAVALSGATIGVPYYGPALFGGPLALMFWVLFLGVCAWLLAGLAAVLGGCSFRSPWGKVGAVGGTLLLVGDLGYLLWAFSLG